MTPRDRFTLRAGLGGFGCAGVLVLLALAAFLASATGGGCNLVSTAPIAEPGYRVFILEESGERTSKLGGLVHHPEVEKYLNEKCVKVNDHPEWRMLDDDRTDAQLNLLSSTWQAAYSRAIKDSSGKRPWLLISDGKYGTSQEPPMERPEFLALLRRYGGA